MNQLYIYMYHNPISPPSFFFDYLIRPWSQSVLGRRKGGKKTKQISNIYLALGFHRGILFDKYCNPISCILSPPFYERKNWEGSRRLNGLLKLTPQKTEGAKSQRYTQSCLVNVLLLDFQKNLTRYEEALWRYLT